MLIRASVDKEARNTGNYGPRSGVAKRIKNVSPQRHRGHREEPVDYFLICQIEDPGELYRGRTDKSKSPPSATSAGSVRDKFPMGFL